MTELISLYANSESDPEEDLSLGYATTIAMKQLQKVSEENTAQNQTEDTPTE